MKAIVAPTDFSEISLNAVRYAADLALSINAGLALLNVCQLPVNYPEIVNPVNMPYDLEEAEKTIEKLKAGMAKRTGHKIKIYTKVRTGYIMEELQNYCSEIKPFAVVMGNQGAGARERLLFGSNTIAAMKNLSWPLLVVPAEARYSSIRKIGLACDLKDVTTTTPFTEIKQLTKEFGATLDIIHVNTSDDKKHGPEIVNESGLLQELFFDIHPRYHFPDSENIEEELGFFAEKNQLDLLMVIPKKHNIIEKIFHKSHSKKLLLHTHIPVMALHE